VLRKGEWRRLPMRRQRMLARYTLAQPFLQAFAGLGIPFAIVTALLAQVPVGVALITFLPAVPTLAMVTFEVVGFREFCRVYYARPRFTDYLRLLISTPFYQMVLAAGACRAVARELRGLRSWEKTSHAGAHRAPGTGAAELARGMDRQAA
jgi:ABC-type polysaccharide transport system permease subunit